MGDDTVRQFGVRFEYVAEGAIMHLARATHSLPTWGHSRYPPGYRGGSEGLPRQ